MISAAQRSAATAPEVAAPLCCRWNSWAWRSASRIRACPSPTSRPVMSCSWVGVIAARGDGHLEPQPVVAAGVQVDLVHREAEILQPADPALHGVPVVGGEVRLGVQHVPQVAVPGRDALRPSNSSGYSSGVLLHPDRQVEQAAGHVLHQDVQVVLCAGRR